jgi:general stress protein 26
MAQQGSGDPRKVYDMIRDVRVAMMTTLDVDGSLHSRPMHTMKPDAQGDLWFFTRRSAPKTAEVEREHAVNLAYADPGSQNYVSVSGRATIVTDQSRIDELWSEPLRAWFPKGKNDPEIALVRVRPERAEYWDSPSSTIVHMVGYAKAALTGEPPHPGEHEKVDLESAR